MPTKQQYTDVFLKNGDDSVDADHAHHYFWYNTRDSGGMRLTSDANEYLLRVLNLEYYEISLVDVKVNNKFLLDLDRFIKCPYYLQTGRRTMMNGGYTKILLFDKKIFFTLTMYNNDFEKFLKAHRL